MFCGIIGRLMLLTQRCRVSMRGKTLFLELNLGMLPLAMCLLNAIIANINLMRREHRRMLSGTPPFDIM